MIASLTVYTLGSDSYTSYNLFISYQQREWFWAFLGHVEGHAHSEVVKLLLDSRAASHMEFVDALVHSSWVLLSSEVLACGVYMRDLIRSH